MRTFDVRHEIIVGSDRFWQLIHHETEFIRSLYVDFLDFGYEVLEDNKETGVRRTYITPKVVAPKAIIRVMGDTISFTEHGLLVEDDDYRYEFTVVPNKFADKIKISGAMRTNVISETSCERCVTFNVKCTIFGIGKLLEGFIQKEIQRSYNESADYTNTYLKKVES
ncbi:MAG: hypothetical protein ACI9KE_000682 [Polyangiales bacterium]|jgi:hypothetical protein